MIFAVLNWKLWHVMKGIAALVAVLSVVTCSEMTRIDDNVLEIPPVIKQALPSGMEVSNLYRVDISGDGDRDILATFRPETPPRSKDRGLIVDVDGRVNVIQRENARISVFIRDVTGDKTKDVVLIWRDGDAAVTQVLTWADETLVTYCEVRGASASGC